MLRLRMGLTLLLAVGWCTLGGCPTGGVTDGGTTGTETLKVNFDPTGGNWAVATDSQGNQYTFRAREESGGTTVTEANIVTKDGQTLKVSLDSSGRPVNVRLSDNTAADLVYDASTGDVSIRLTDSTGNVISTARGIKSNAKSSEVRARQQAAWGKRATWADGDTDVDKLQKGLAKCEEIIESVTDTASNPETPLNEDSTNETVKRLTTNLKNVAKVASTADVAEVEEEELGEDVTADEIPAAVLDLAGQTYKLFEVDPNLICLGLFPDIANQLTFNSEGILLTEYDRRFLFKDWMPPDTSARGEERSINYESLTEVVLANMEDDGYDLNVTPIFTGTQLDDNGKITIERRFTGFLEYENSLWTSTALFDVAFINGQLNEDKSIFEADLVVVDLQKRDDDGAVGESVYPIGRVRYYNQNKKEPKPQWPCEPSQEEVQEQQQQNPDLGIECPGTADVGEGFEVTFNPGDADLEDFELDWYISSGSGVVTDVAADGTATVAGTDAGLLEVTLLVHDMRDPIEQSLLVYTCTVAVGELEQSEVAEAALDISVPTEFRLWEPLPIKASGSLLSTLDYKEWYVTGTYWYYLEDPYRANTQLEFWELPSDIGLANFTVWFYGEDYETGDWYLLWVDVTVTEDEVEWEEPEEPEEVFSELAGSYEGELTSPSGWAHTFTFEIDDEGNVTGTSTWAVGEFQLSGYAYTDGYIYFEDDAADYYGYAVGIYEGYWEESMDHFMGAYYEDDWDNYIGEWTAEFNLVGWGERSAAQPTAENLDAAEHPSAASLISEPRERASEPRRARAATGRERSAQRGTARGRRPTRCADRSLARAARTDRALPRAARTKRPPPTRLRFPCAGCQPPRRAASPRSARSRAAGDRYAAHASCRARPDPPTPAPPRPAGPTPSPARRSAV